MGEIMKKLSMVVTAVALTVAVSACGKDEPDSSIVSKIEPQVVISTEYGGSDVGITLSVPVVKEGVQKAGEDAVEMRFEWDSVEEAEGYEVCEESKFHTEENYREAVKNIETSDTFYVTGAQDEFDFRIRVRAFKRSGNEKVYSDWSSYATGSIVFDDKKTDVGADPYQELLDVIAKGLKEGFPEGKLDELGMTASVFYTGDKSYEILGYLLKDLDGDGVEELLIGENAADGSGPDTGWDSIIYDMFAIRGGELVHIFDGWERNRYYLCENGAVANEGSSGAAYSSWEFFTYKNGELKLIESIFTDEDAQFQSHWYHFDKPSYEDKSNEITADEGNQIVEKYVYQKLNFIPFQ